MNIQTKKSLLATIIGLSAAAGGMQQAYGQDGEGATAQRALDEIIVTATKKGIAENVQDVPIAITAFNADQIDKSLAVNLTDIGNLVPNVTLGDNGTLPGYSQFFIRGMGVDSSAISYDPAVGVYVDGMYLGVSAGSLTNLFDLESVEVLRGPQGTLLGRNVTGGAILLRSKRPTGEFGGRVRGTYGSYDRVDAEFSLEGPLVEDKLAARLSVRNNRHDGYFNNIADPNGKRLNWQEATVIRPSFRITPTDNLTADLIFEYGKEVSGIPATQSISDPGTLATVLGYTPPSNSQVVNQDNFSGNNTVEWENVIAEVNWNIGEGTITSVTAYRETETEVEATDQDGTPLGLLYSDQRTDLVNGGYIQDQFSQELRYAADIYGQVDLTAGLYYFTQNAQAKERTNLDLFGITVVDNGFIDHETVGAFIQGDIDLTDNLVVTLGARYTEETKDIRFSLRNTCDLNFAGCAFFEDDKSWENVSFKVGLQWRIDESMQAYTSFSRGFRSGGFNIRGGAAIAGFIAYDEEHVDAFEVGFKSELFDERLRLNLAAFLNQYEDLQRTVTDPSQVPPIVRVQNAADAEVKGIEIEATAIVTDSFTIFGALGLMSAEFESFPGLIAGSDGKGLDMARVPEVTYNLGGEYDIPLDGGGNVLVRGHYSFVGDRPVNDQNAADLESYKRLNFSATYYSTGENFSIAAFGKNLTNSSVGTTGYRSLSFTNILPPPRTWGVELTYQF